ncbi:MAG: response regulator transcription factor [Elusimicrobia bacterium]|nr:response regulator transcription factor [Elusimicrobiota bacterium]
MDRKTRVLVVDDSAEFLRLVAAFLGGDYEVEVAETAEDAFALIRLRKPDVLLLDLMMPGISGFDILRLLKSGQALSGVTVMIVSACTLDASARSQLIRSMGVHDILAKPFAGSELAGRVAALSAGRDGALKSPGAYLDRTYNS